MMDQPVEALLQAWDGEDVIIRFDRPSGAWIVIAIHSTRMGPASGGTRLKSYPDLPSALQDALNLASSMTVKFAAADLARGGGKAVIAVPPGLDPEARTALLRRYGGLIHQLGGFYHTGPDVGTSAGDMDIIAETGAPYVFGRTREAGGAGDSGPITALGVFHGIAATGEQLWGTRSIAGRRVLVQGAGHVGGRLIALLREAGADVLFNDVEETVIRQVRDQLGLPYIPVDAIYDAPCDIFSPCALGGVLNEDTIPRLHCRAVAGAANNQLATPHDAERLRKRQILYAPDYVINMGGAMMLIGRESLGWTESESEARVVEQITKTLRQVFELAGRKDITTSAAAQRIVDARLSSS